MSTDYLAVIGHANIDVLLDVQALPGPGESRPVQRRSRVYGGTACNIARHAAGLGVATRLWARVGRDFPPDWRVELLDAGVNLDYLDIDEVRDTPTCFILTSPDGAQAYCMDQGAMGALTANPPTEGLLDGLTGWLHIGTGTPDAYVEIAEKARQAGVAVALDPGQEIHFAYDANALRALLEHSDLLWCNEGERDAMLKMLDTDLDGLERLVPRVIVTHGAKGVSMHVRGEPVVRIDGLQVDVVDPTGAGDALRAGVYRALSRGRPWLDALSFGQEVAAACLKMRGPQPETIRMPLLHAEA